MRVRARLTAVIALVGAMIVGGVAPQASASTDEVVFDGSGWGHGVGMSQYGAYGMATLGSSYTSILSHYYRGTQIASLPSSRSIWVNLEEKFTSKTLVVLNLDPHKLGADVVIQSPAGTATAEPGATIALALDGTSGCRVTVNKTDGSTEEVTSSPCVVDMNWYDWTSSAQPTTKISISGCYLADWNVSPTTMRPCQYARGELHLRNGSGGLYLSAEMLMDDYVVGISEVPYNWHMEAQKAQAVAARSYAEARRITRGTPSAANGCWCHVRDTTSDQRYVGWGHELRGPWINATNGTARQILTHPDSNLGSQRVIAAYYSSSSGGKTEHGHIVGFSNSQVEWLTSVSDSRAVDGTVRNPNASWTAAVSPTTVAQALGFDSLTSAAVISTRPGSGSAAEVRYRGIKNGQSVEAVRTSTWTRRTFGLRSEYFTVSYSTSSSSQVNQTGDEMLLYKSDGTFQYNSLHPNGSLGATIHSGSNYTSGWKAITAIDLDGDGQDEIMFYRDDGLYRYYHIGADGRVGSPIQAGSEYTKGWDSIVAVDLDGDGRDEIFFYRKDGLYRYYDIRANGRIGSPIKAGSEYTKGWDSIVAVDLDGDGRDEMFFYRSDGLYRFYNVRSDGSIGSPIRAGDNYTKNWDSIVAVDLNGDGKDEMFFYRKDGLYRFYNVRSDGSLGSPISSGSNFSKDWSIVTGINLDGK